MNSQKNIESLSKKASGQVNAPQDSSQKNLNSKKQLSSSNNSLDEKSRQSSQPAVNQQLLHPASLEEFNRSDFLLLAKLAEQTERFDEMIGFVKKYISMSSSLLSLDERYYFTTAYKNSVGNRRAELRLLTSIELKEQRNQNKTMLENLKKYKKKIEDELTQLCNELIDIIDEKMLPYSKNPENEIYYKKMKADYMR